MKHNARMGLIDRIFKPGKDKSAPPTQASTQFYESEPDTGESAEERNAPRRELVQVVLRDTMRKHGVPSDWIDCRILSAVTRSGRRGLHVNFVVRQAHEQLLPYVFAFQDDFERELARFEPRCRDWLMSLGWEFAGAKASELSAQKGRAGAGDPEVPAQAGVAAAALAPASRPGDVEGEPRSDDEVQRDLQALFAIRDAALADAAKKPSRKAARDPHQPDFEPTQPFEDDEGGKPRV